MLQPTFALSLGGLTITTSNAVAGPRTFLVERAMDVAADALQVQLMHRADIGLDDEVELRLGHDGKVEQVFVGNVAQLRPTLAGVTIVALGNMRHLLNLRMAAFFENQSAGSIVHAVIGEAEAEAGIVDDGPTLPRFAIDSRLSGYAHVKALADRLGFELYANRDGAIMFHALGAAADLDALGGGLLGVATAAAGAIASGLVGGGEMAYQFAQHLVHTTATRSPQPGAPSRSGGKAPCLARVIAPLTG